jgi:hypothetical protein
MDLNMSRHATNTVTHNMANDDESFNKEMEFIRFID